MFERFTRAARTAVVRAQEEAREQGSPTIGAEHLLFGVLTDTAGAPAVVLGRFGIDAALIAATSRRDGQLDADALATLGIDVDEVRRRTEDAFGPGALDEPPRTRWGRGIMKGHIPFTAEAKAALSQAVRAAAFHGDREIGSAQLFLGLLTEETVVLALSRCATAPSTEDLTRLIRAELDQAA